MFGLPGDLTPPNRFVRLAVLTRFSDLQPDSARTLNLAQHIIHNFDIPFGLVTDTSPDKKNVLKESMQWVTFRDLTHRIVYFKTYDNQNLHKIDLSRLDFSGTQVKRIPMFETSEMIVNITDQSR
jgi:choloylglycine hydrolase